MPYQPQDFAGFSTVKQMESPTSTLAPYSYREFSGRNSLRLLRLQPAPAGQESVDCHLFETRLVESDQYEQGVRPEDYEALSWCWGSKKPSRLLRIIDGDQAYEFLISADLEAGLRALRFEDKMRLLWVDAICINQDNVEERNQQVPRMNQIYGQAKRVCIWIGDEDKTSAQAIHFIKEKVLKLWDFDELCAQLNMGEQWRGMSELMKRPWFSRRWVVQEISLAESGQLYCGKENLPWQDFADAVSLFVAAESAGHKLSDVMRKDKNFNQITDFYGHVPALGAALLVDATSNLFRSSKKDKKARRERLLSLEHLVSKYTVFEATESRDTIYALLAIAKDTTPQPMQQNSLNSLESFRKFSSKIQHSLTAWVIQPLESEAYPVDYKVPELEVYKYFVQFAIRRSERQRALNIICRHWAPPLNRKDKNVSTTEDLTNSNGNLADSTILGGSSPLPTLPSWIPDLSGAAFVMREHEDSTAGERMIRENADPLVGMPGDDQRSYSAAGTREVSLNKLKWTNRGRYYSMFVEGFVFDEIKNLEEISRAGIIPPTWRRLAKWYDISTDPPEEFWRTLVADRGPHGRNMQSFYPRACKEAIRKVQGGVVQTSRMIEHGRSSIIADYLRRVQAVIWNRRLIRTQSGHLGLVHQSAKVGDRICILYGCNVPVVLRKIQKLPQEIAQERLEAEQEQKERVQKLASSVVGAWKRGRENRQRALRLEWVDWTLLRFVWSIILIVFTEYRLGLNLRQAVLVNCPLLIFPQVMRPLKPNLTEYAWSVIRKWIYYIRLMFLAFLAVFVASWIDRTIESMFVTTSIIVLLPSLLIPDEDYRYIFSGRWVVPMYNKSLTWALPEKVQNLVIEEPADAYWRLIGECYVDGMMDGEAIALQNQNRPDNKMPPQVFELR